MGGVFGEVYGVKFIGLLCVVCEVGKLVLILFDMGGVWL